MQTEGGFVQPHIDGNVGEELKFRCTLLVNKPDKGGKLVLAQREYTMDEGDVYCFLSNNTRHGTTPVKGNTPRMACSLGFIVDKAFRPDVEPDSDFRHPRACRRINCGWFVPAAEPPRNVPHPSTLPLRSAQDDGFF